MSYKFRIKGDLKNALSELLKPLRRASGNKLLKLDLRKIAIGIIDSLKIEANVNKTILDFYIELKAAIKTSYDFDVGSGLRTGHAKTFYEENTINELLPFIRVDTKSEDLVRTIHSSKGTEFENVLVHFETISEFRKYILDGSNHIELETDDCRIYYVACSRAMVNLFINIPEASEADIEAMENMNLTYEIL